jgi:hypothetical protein
MLIVQADEVNIQANLRLCWPDLKTDNHDLDDERVLLTSV